MKKSKLFGLSSAICLCAASLQAQEANQVEQLKKQIQQMQENFERQQRLQQQEIQSLKEQMGELKKATDQEKARRLMEKPLIPGGTPTVTGGSAVQMEEMQRRLDELTESSKKTLANQFNPEIGFVSETIFGYRSQGNDKTGDSRFGGFDVFQRSAEISFAASIDPFARGYAILNGESGTDGETTFGLEEAALVTTSLPWNLTARAGRFFGEFGRLAYRHPHERPFHGGPLVIDNFVGGESKTDGFELNYLFPTKPYISLTLGAGTQFGDPINNVSTFRTPGEMNLWGRLSTYVDLSSNLSLEAGLSGLLNDRAEDRGGLLAMPDGSTQMEKRRRVAGLDFTLRYTPLDKSTRRGFEWGTELLYNAADFDFDPDGSFDPANPANQIAVLDGGGLPVTDALGNPITTTVTGPSGDEFRSGVRSTGLYTYLAAKLSRQWTAGFAFDWLQSPLQKRDETYRYSPYFTYNPSEFQTIRLQYSYTDRRDFYAVQQDDHAIYLQWSFILGAHTHGFRNR